MNGKKVKHKFELEVRIQPQPGGYHAYCPSLKGLHIDAQSQKEALGLIKKAAKLHIESMLEYGDPFPLNTLVAAEIIQPPPDQLVRLFNTHVSVPITCHI
ncbi:MAG: type II toxin-antitoxin system HicB family antitoxin [bacterium]